MRVRARMHWAFQVAYVIGEQCLIMRVCDVLIRAEFTWVNETHSRLEFESVRLPFAAWSDMALV